MCSELSEVFPDIVNNPGVQESILCCELSEVFPCIVINPGVQESILSEWQII